MGGYRYLESPSVDPAFNLALEQYVFAQMPRQQSYVMLWQNNRAVIVGKYQNTLDEIDEAYVDSHGVKVVRRLSGGGAVYHDLGNLNYTVITDEEQEGIFFAGFCEPVVRFLAELGVKAELSGRNDILIDGKKCSGSAQYVKEGRVMHHGSILFDADLEAVSCALRGAPDKLRSKGVASVRSRVTNIRPYLREDMPMDQFRERFRAFLLETWPMDVYTLTEEDLRRTEELRRTVYDRWEWNYGASPRYNVRARRYVDGCGTVEVFAELREGRFRMVRFCGDFFGMRGLRELEERLCGCPPEREALGERIRGVKLGEYFRGMEEETFLALLAGLKKPGPRL